MRTRSIHPVATLLTCAWLACLVAASAQAGESPPSFKPGTTADHAKFKELQREFKSGPEVTQACLQCHTEAARQIHRTKHWTWEYVNPDTQQRLGKKTIANNFCIAIASNQESCTTCHVGYGWKDSSFDFTSEANVDCLVCHDTTGNYRKTPGMAGHVLAKDTELPPGSGKIVKGVDLAKVAQKVGKTSRDTCGACHFFGGGGDAVKHGDLDSSMAAPDKALDVHMDATGLDFTCATCHKGSSHDVAGSRYAPTAKDDRGAHQRGNPGNGNPATCVACHGNGPHKTEARLNQHATKVACQTCHIPSYARGGLAVKTSWDWSTAGQRDEKSQHVTRKDAKGRITYESRKGDFTYGENVVPEYMWFNGQVSYTLVGDKIEKSDRPTPINRLGGSASDGKSMIWPIRVFRGKQPYDPVNQTLVTPHTAGNDDTGYWKNLVWDKAIAVGMNDSGHPFSGQVDFVSTEMSWPITHMVAPKEQALVCTECHASGGRLAKVEGVYLPGRDRHPLIELLGWAAAIATLAGVLVHGAVRVVRSRAA